MHAQTREDALEAVEGQVVLVLADDDVRQQPRAARPLSTGESGTGAMTTPSCSQLQAYLPRAVTMRTRDAGRQSSRSLVSLPIRSACRDAAKFASSVVSIILLTITKIKSYDTALCVTCTSHSNDLATAASL